MDRLVKTLTGTINVTSLAVAGDGDRVLSGLETSDAGIDLWGLEAGAVLRHLTGLRSGATSVALDPSGRAAAASSMDAEAVCWNADTGAMVKLVPPPGPSGDRNGRVVFSPDGQVILSAYLGSITLFDAALSPKLKFRVQEAGATLLSVAIAPGGALVAVGYVRFDGDNDIRVFDLVSGQPTLNVTAHRGSGVTSLAWSGVGLLSGSGSGALSLIGAANGAQIRSFAGHTRAVESVALAAGDRLAASGSDDGTVKIWDVATGDQLASLDHGSGVSAVAFMPDAKSVLSGGARMVKLWNVSDLIS